MVKIGEIYLGGNEGHPRTGIIYPSGIAFSLKNKSSLDRIFKFESDNWEIEIQKGNRNIVARYKDTLTEDQILSKGFEYCQKSLDLISVSNHTSLIIQNSGYDFVMLYNKERKTIARIQINCDRIFSIGTSVTVKDSAGNVVEPPQVLQLDWIPAFRYYRISQAETDLYQAYQNLYLAFESLLQDVAPRHNGEKEIDWLPRALTEVGQKVPLTTLVPGVLDPISEIKEHHYKDLRCKLFHAKDRDYILPNDCPNPIEISEAYEKLIRIWRQIASAFRNVPSGGGVVTYQGFMAFMDCIGNQGFCIQFTDDSSPESINDTKVSPLGHSVFSTTENEYIRDFQPGIVLFRGVLENPQQLGLMIIHRVCLISSDVLYSVASYEEGICPTGIDRLENYETFRLVNASSPKTIF